MFPSKNNSNLKFGLNVKKKLSTSSNQPRGVSNNIFGEEGEDYETPAPSVEKLNSNLKPSGLLSKAQQKDFVQIKEALDEDPQAFDYDEVYDSMKASERALKELKKGKDDRKPRYVKSIFEATELRKRDRLRAEEKMLEKERIREGELYKDKEKFITSAYKKQLEELRNFEKDDNEEERRNGLGGMTSFYKGLLEDKSKLNEAAKLANKDSVTVEHKDIDKPKSYLLEKALQSGKRIELNDDNEVVDKRQLLSAGLNLNSVKKLSHETNQNDSSSAYDEFFQRKQAKLEAEKLKLKMQLNNRAKRSLQLQVTENAKVEAETQTKKLEEVKRKFEQRNDQNTISDAKRRYLERKQKDFLKQNLEE